MFLALEGDETFGREESRGAYLLDRRDFAKLHIIAHYVRVLSGSSFHVAPIGCVGGDDAGHSIKRELCREGIDVSHVRTVEDLPTMFSVCLFYPDGQGGNITTLNSASTAVTVRDVETAEPLFRRFRDRGVALAAPEVPIAARQAVLRLATSYGFFRAGSFVRAELTSGAATPLLADLDLLVLNCEEAAALAEVPPGASSETIATSTRDVLASKYRRLATVVTAGMHGSWVWDGDRLWHEPGLEANVVNTAGAGDAHLAALIVALGAGAAIREANAFATVVSAMKVSSEDTINWAIDPLSVQESSVRYQRPIPAQLLDRLRQAATDVKNALRPTAPGAYTSTPVHAEPTARSSSSRASDTASVAPEIKRA
jgi:sugar/nucleoside kinase (ribokinase family)